MNAKSCSTSCTPKPALVTARPGQILIGDKNYCGRDFETDLADAGLNLMRPARKGRTRTRLPAVVQTPPPTIESIFWTAEGQLDLEHHGGHTATGVHLGARHRTPATPPGSSLRVPETERTG
jgi:hypothetical protein